VRGETGRASGKAAGALTAVLQELGVVLRRDHEELELRVAQLEHRLALLERRADDGGGDAPDAPAD
jgi:polyhydroxyalkanoate synthesis regulator phasin